MEFTFKLTQSFRHKFIAATSATPKPLFTLTVLSAIGAFFYLASTYFKVRIPRGCGNGGGGNGRLWFRILGIYKVYDLSFFDGSPCAMVGSEDLLEITSLRCGGIYTKAELQKELKYLSTCGMFEKVDFEGKTNPDGTISITIFLVENTWQSADKFTCINLPINMDPEKDYRRKVERARPCLLPMPVQGEVLQMLRQQGKVSTTLLQRIRDRVQKWYHDEGYACAQVHGFGNLNTGEIVCAVVEGEITQVLIQFHDKLGNVCEESSQLAAVKRELPEQLQKGRAFNMKAAKQALTNINSLALFSNIQINSRADEKNEGGTIIEIKLTELEEEENLAEVSGQPQPQEERHSSTRPLPIVAPPPADDD